MIDHLLGVGIIEPLGHLFRKPIGRSFARAARDKLEMQKIQRQIVDRRRRLMIHLFPVAAIDVRSPFPRARGDIESARLWAKPVASGRSLLAGRASIGAGALGAHRRLDWIRRPSVAGPKPGVSLAGRKRSRRPLLDRWAAAVALSGGRFIGALALDLSSMDNGPS